MPAIIHHFPCLSDNVGVLIHDPVSHRTIAIDAPEERPILEALANKGWTLSDILITHNHWDHVQAVPALKQRFNVKVIASAEDARRINGVDEGVEDGALLRLGTLEAQVIATPGHTQGHVAYWFPALDAAFVGDTLFVMGCGRVQDGLMTQMWASLQRLRSLPDETRLYCGHDYALSNARFAAHVAPDNADVLRRLKQAEMAQAADERIMPSTLQEEKRTNPFLRADDPALAAAVKKQGQASVDVFSALRLMKNEFSG